MVRSEILNLGLLDLLEIVCGLGLYSEGRVGSLLLLLDCLLVHRNSLAKNLVLRGLHERASATTLQFCRDCPFLERFEQVHPLDWLGGRLSLLL